jgi:hypothetical protein
MDGEDKTTQFDLYLIVFVESFFSSLFGSVNISETLCPRQVLPLLQISRIIVHLLQRNLAVKLPQYINHQL